MAEEVVHPDRLHILGLLCCLEGLEDCDFDKVLGILPLMTGHQVFSHCTVDFFLPEM